MKRERRKEKETPSPAPEKNSEIELPDDPTILQHMVRELLDRLSRMEQGQEEQRRKIDELLRRLYGPRSEKVNPDQLPLFESDPPALPTPAPPEKQQTAPRRRGHGRRKLPANLPRRRVEHPVPERERLCACCGKPKEKIRDEESEHLDYEPASLYVVVNVRPVYACKGGCQEPPVVAPLPARPIDKGIPGPGLLAHVAVSKYADHLPLYRQEDILGRHGIHIARSTLCGWVAEAAGMAMPIVRVMKDEVLRSKVIATDETPIQVLDRANKRTFTGRLWVYVGDRGHPHLVYDYTPTRERHGPMTFLAGYRGYLQADAYGGYDGLYVDDRISEVACWMHCRRYWFEASLVEASRPLQVIAMISQLYRIEDECATFAPEERYRHRQERAVPVLHSIRKWMDDHQREILPKSPTGVALRYTRNQWNALVRYTEDGDLDIDNGRSERALRGIAVGRSNWLFAGSEDGGQRAAVLYSLISTCKLHRVDPEAYLRDVFRRLPSHPADQAHELTPVAWARARSEQLAVN